MARKVEVTLIDDIDGSSATRTFEFGIEGASYEIDLSEANIKKFNDAVADFVDNARRVGGGSRRGRGRGAGRASGAAASTGGAKPQDVRRWAAGKGLEVSERGRIPREVMEAYEAAH